MRDVFASTALVLLGWAAPALAQDKLVDVNVGASDIWRLPHKPLGARRRLKNGCAEPAVVWRSRAAFL